MLNAEDLGDYFRVPADNRDLNYNKYEIHGNEKINEMQEYTSHNTQRLDVDGMIKLLIKMGKLKNENFSPWIRRNVRTCSKRYFENKGHEVYATSRDKNDINYFDLTDNIKILMK